MSLPFNFNPLLLLRSLLAVFFAFVMLSAQAQPLNYQLGPGDVIDISVYEEADLSFQVRLGESGSIPFPFIGEVQIQGNDTSAIERSIEQALISGEFLIRPEVTVNILEYRPFYIDGEVVNPGSYPFEPGLTLRKAVAIAGGFTERASRSKISIISNTTQSLSSSGQIEILETPVNPDDIITVEQRFF